MRLAFEDSNPTELFRPQTPPAAPPVQIGRYRIGRLLGRGGFGVVYLAHDEHLDRSVAIKVPHSERWTHAEQANLYLREAQTVAKLDDPHVVPVYDVGTTPEHPLYIVSKYIDGSDLATAARGQWYSVVASVELIATLAGALHNAHRQGVVHRDIKPGNILIDRAGRPYLSDFGLALREQDVGTELAYVGTPAYMSPEQARGEGHRVDGRSDIYSLGVVLYELLTHRRPFQSASTTDLLEQIATLDVRPPRQFWDGIPKELEQICLRALARRALDRYTTAKDFADDLRHFLGGVSGAAATGAAAAWAGKTRLEPAQGEQPAGTLSSSRRISVLPKGLRAFDRGDADFFLDLLPGPRDRDGLPSSIRFWKTQIEQPDAEASFRVGVIYGPSGCGKSSLVRAGLLPRLAPTVRPVTVVATSGETERHLLDQIRAAFPELAAEEGLAQTLKRVRIGRNAPGGARKVLIVLDQFEQWLHAADPAAQRGLITALRQCDGVRLQCLVIVRDDFWMSVSRFMHQLEIPIVEGLNSSAIDLFDKRHARRVLHAFGAAYGALPRSSNELSLEQEQFLDEAIAALSDTDYVICVRLALFAQMLKDKQWTTATLRLLGGAQGIGVRFLEETFNSATAPLEHRRLQGPVRTVLQSLLPEHGAEIKGASRSEAELAAVVGCRPQSAAFQQLLAILSDELRLLTPIDPEDTNQQTAEAGSDLSDELRPADARFRGPPRRYQLTHDYLVPALREWLTQKQRETRRGRAELRLADRAALWSKTREPKQLPTFAEAVGIALYTDRARWTTAERLMMKVAGRLHLLRVTSLTAAALVLATVFLLLQHRSREALRLTNAQALVDNLLVAEVERLPEIITMMQEHRDAWQQQLTEIADDESRTNAERLRARLALSSISSEHVAAVIEQISAADPATVRVSRQLLDRHRSLAATVAWEIALGAVAKDADAIVAEPLRMAVLLAAYDPQDDRWTRLTDAAAGALIRSDQKTIDEWARLLSPVMPQLMPALREWFSSPRALTVERLIATRVLADTAPTETLCALILEADSDQFSVLMPAIARAPGDATAVLRAETASVPTRAASVSDRLARAQQASNAAAALLRLGAPASLLEELEDREDPTTRTRLIDSLHDLGVPAKTVLELYDREQTSDVQQALLLALGQYIDPELPQSTEAAILQRANVAFRESPRLAVRSAGAYLLTRLGAPPEEGSLAAPAGSDWSLTGQGQVLRVIQGPVTFPMGSPEDEPWSERHHETLHAQAIPHSYAIGATEVTVADFLRFQQDFPYAADVTADPHCPVSNISWLDAVRYCRWLSEVEGIPPDQMCYPPLDEIGEDMVLPADLLLRTGYRLPTEVEWEYACRSGSATRWACGEDQDRLNQYCWSIVNGDEQLQPAGRLRPNAFGLFDMHGNACEWCHNVFSEYPLKPADSTKYTGRDNRSLRSGSYRSLARRCRSAQRFSYPPETRMSIIGFRIARTMPEQLQAPP